MTPKNAWASGNISNGLTAQAKVTFPNGLTRTFFPQEKPQSFQKRETLSYSSPWHRFSNEIEANLEPYPNVGRNTLTNGRTELHGFTTSVREMLLVRPKPLAATMSV